jgi:F0F1-type ATP synthase alpha subunit
MDYSDGIARVHGMNNVQAEELVEYATPQPIPQSQTGN